MIRVNGKQGGNDHLRKPSICKFRLHTNLTCTTSFLMSIFGQVCIFYFKVARSLKIVRAPSDLVESFINYASPFAIDCYHMPGLVWKIN